MEPPVEVQKHFDRLYGEIDKRILLAADGRPMPPAWIDRFRRTCEAMRYKNVEGLLYGDFRAAFFRHYRMDHEYVLGEVQKIVGDLPRAFDPQLLEKLSGI